MWEQIFKDEFDKDIDKEYDKIEKELEDINENPRIDLDYGLQQQEESLKKKQETLNDLKRNVRNLKEAIKNSNKEAIAEYVENIDLNITERFMEIDYFGTHYPFHDFFTSLFEIVLGIDIDKDYESTLEGVPIEKWVELYKEINGDAIKKAIGRTQDDPEDLESMQYYADLARHIRDIVRHCINTGSELRISDELYHSEDEERTDGRIEEVMFKYINHIQ
jgi:hypothetical protein